MFTYTDIFVEIVKMLILELQMFKSILLHVDIVKIQPQNKKLYI